MLAVAIHELQIHNISLYCLHARYSLLDAIYDKDPNARVAVECFAKTGFVVVGGEITTSAYVIVYCPGT
ncbi:MAG: S-adenosylmethionine synthetase N-terminal domain-containing protein [Candidatus Scalindua sp.]|nr:S-adenosylmethionine synthetase N-terminal domain-containing protein [Candidatus Scalindua sp.]